MSKQKLGHWNDAARFLRQAAKKLNMMADLDENVTYETAEQTSAEIKKLKSEAATLVTAALVRFDN